MRLETMPEATRFSIETRRYPRTKIEKTEKIFTSCKHGTYTEIHVYNFVDFRAKRAGSSNCRRP
jgi:hypothetical protein